jgi:hypothetical protein
MNDDEVLTAALRRAADEVPAGPAPTDAVVAAGRALRRRRTLRRTAVTTAAATAAVAAAVITAVTGSLPHRPPTGVSSAARPTATAAPAPRVVEAGRWTGTGRGNRVRLSTDGRLTVAHDAGTVKHQDTAARLRTAPAAPAAPLTATAFDDATGTLLAGICRTTPAPARITVTLAGRTAQARLLTLPSRPGWIAYYAEIPGAHTTTRQPVVTAHSAAGTTVATVRGATEPVSGTG